jgi:hypothetical protein
VELYLHSQYAFMAWCSFKKAQGQLYLLPQRPALGPTHPPIQWVPVALSLGVKWPRLEADHQPQSSVEVSAWSYTSTLPVRIMAWCLVNHRSYFAFTSTHFGRTLRRGIAPSQGLYLHRTTQHRRTQTYPCLERDSKPRFQ